MIGEGRKLPPLSRRTIGSSKEELQSQTSILDDTKVAAEAAPTKRWFL